MSLFKRSKQPATASVATANSLAELALVNIHDGVMIVDRAGRTEYANPAAVAILGVPASDLIGLDFSLLFKIETTEGRPLPENENLLLQAFRTRQPLENYKVCLIVGQAGKRIPVAFSTIPVNDQAGSYIITFRNITKELAEEGEQAEFISTASHEMRTPVASIEGYLSLALNPQTASIDARARGYLTAAHAAAKHLGQLFHDLLDVTKLDDGHLRPTFQPVEMISLIKRIADQYHLQIDQAGLKYQFGSSEPDVGTARRLDQVVYGYVDVNFMSEIIDNLLGNAIKYTPAGGSIYVNVRGDGDRALINVTDTGIGISGDDLPHIFQKFYRSDNSDTRTIGGTGLGLYLVKQRVEALSGRVWAESAFGEGSTFYVSLPRISGEEYEKRMIALNNNMASAAPGPIPVAPSPAAFAPAPPASPVPGTSSAPSAPISPVAPAAPVSTTPNASSAPGAPMNVPSTPNMTPIINNTGGIK